MGKPVQDVTGSGAKGRFGKPDTNKPAPLGPPGLPVKNDPSAMREGATKQGRPTQPRQVRPGHSY